MKRKPIPEHMLTGRYFCELIHLHNWPPMFAPSGSGTVPKGAAAMPQTGRGGWGDGTVLMPGTPAYQRPGWLHQARQA